MELLTVENLTFSYPLCGEPALRDVSFTVEKGEFAVLCGATGSGKSTLLRLLKRELAPKGERTGRILYRGIEAGALSPREAASSIGFVTQNPEQQLVTDKVWHELAFGLENMNVPRDVIARRVAEMASYFGIEAWYDKRVSELSGGQKQLLNLAAVMVMDPEILILDEPTAQLDPIAASEFLATLKKLNRELSLTVVTVEHRLEELIPLCDRLLILENGRLRANGAPREVIATLGAEDGLLRAMPCAARLCRSLVPDRPCPLTVREGRRMIEECFGNTVRALPKEEYAIRETAALSLREVFARYEREQPDVLRGLSLTVYENEIFCLLGGNGSGKTTALSVAAGLLRPYSGEVRVFGRRLKDYKNQSLYRNCLALLPQDVQTVFLRNTVREELADVGADPESLPFDLRGLYDRHPYDLSGGEQQLVALAKVLAGRPRLLLMDEPTKGLDADRKAALTEILRRLKAEGVTVLIVTHDVEFTAMCADRCALFFRGQAVSFGTPDVFFAENSFYTTAASRMTRGYYDRAVTVEDVAELCRRNREGENCDRAAREGGTPC